MYNLIKLKKLLDNDSGIETDDSNTVEYFSDYFNVFSDYKAQLKSLNKRILTHFVGDTNKILL